jgi:hypothetical protein
MPRGRYEVPTGVCKAESGGWATLAELRRVRSVDMEMVGTRKAGRRATMARHEYERRGQEEGGKC